MNETTTKPPLNVKIVGMPAWVESYPLNVVYKGNLRERTLQPRKRNPILEERL